MIRFRFKEMMVIGAGVLLTLSLLSGPALSAGLLDGDAGVLGPKDARKRWESLPEERQSYLREKYDYFKSLPESEKRRLKERHKKLEIIRENILSTEEAESGTQPEVSKEELDGKVRKFFKRRERELKKRFPVRPGRKRSEGIRYLRESVEAVAFERMPDFLRQVEEEGLITREEAEKIELLPPPERMTSIFEIGRDRFLREMEGLLSEEDLETLRNLDPWEFNMVLHLERDRRGMIGPAGHTLELTPEQIQALHAMPEGPERDRLKDEFLRNNLSEWLKKLGEDPKSIERTLSMRPRERQRHVMRKLRSLDHRGQKLGPEHRKRLDFPVFERMRSKRRDNGKRLHRRPRPRPNRNGARPNGEGEFF